MSIFKGLGWLFRSLWRLLNFTRLMLVNLLFLIVVLVIVFSVSQKEAPKAPIEGALTLNLNGVLVEQRSQTDPTVQLLRQMDSSDETSRARSFSPTCCGPSRVPRMTSASRRW